MRSRYILLCCFLVGANLLFSQSDKISCDLTNLYQLTINQSPTLQRQHIQNRSAEVNQQSAASLFDYQLFSNLSLNRSGINLFSADPRKDIIGNQAITNNMGLSGGVQKTFRSGLTVNAGIEYSRIADNFPFNSFNENVGSFVSNNNTSTTVSVSQPLLRGRGRSITTANEKIAAISVENQVYTSSFIASGELFNTVLGYWQYLGAQKALDIYQANEARVNKVLDITTELVKADKRPTSDLIQIQADLKDKERQTIAAQQQLYTARQNLGRQVGLSTVESEGIGFPDNDFPVLEAVGNTTDLSQLIEIAHHHRTDLKALGKALEIANVSLEVANNNLKPQLDVTGFVTYGGTDTGNSLTRFFSALGQQEGRNYQAGVGLSYVFPVNNNAAEAALLSNQLQYSDREIQIKNQIRNIELNVSIAYNNFLNSIEAVKKSKQSLTYYEEVFQNEQFKFQTGLTTLLNLILFQERLTFAQLDYIQNQQQFAIAISNLRYETGTLFTHNQIQTQNKPIDLDLFYTLPK